jgi:hypothetical protein
MKARFTFASVIGGIVLVAIARLVAQNPGENPSNDTQSMGSSDPPIEYKIDRFPLDPDELVEPLPPFTIDLVSLNGDTVLFHPDTALAGLFANTPQSGRDYFYRDLKTSNLSWRHIGWNVCIDSDEEVNGVQTLMVSVSPRFSAGSVVSVCGGLLREKWHRVGNSLTLVEATPADTTDIITLLD